MAAVVPGQEFPFEVEEASSSYNRRVATGQPVTTFNQLRPAEIRVWCRIYLRGGPDRTRGQTEVQEALVWLGPEQMELAALSQPVMLEVLNFAYVKRYHMAHSPSPIPNKQHPSARALQPYAHQLSDEAREGAMIGGARALNHSPPTATSRPRHRLEGIPQIIVKELTSNSLSFFSKVTKARGSEVPTSRSVSDSGYGTDDTTEAMQLSRVWTFEEDKYTKRLPDNHPSTPIVRWKRPLSLENLPSRTR